MNLFDYFMFSWLHFNMFYNETKILTFDTDCWYRDCPTWENKATFLGNRENQHTCTYHNLDKYDTLMF